MTVVLIGRWLIILGVVFLLLGGLFVLLGKVPFLGHLPGDIHIQRKSFAFFFPITTCLVLSVVLSALLWFLTRK